MLENDEEKMSLTNDDGYLMELDDYYDYPVCNTEGFPCEFCDYGEYINGCLRCSNGKCAFF